MNGREAEAIASKPGDSDEEDPEVPGKHKFRSKSRTSQSLDPWKKILQSKFSLFHILPIVLI